MPPSKYPTELELDILKVLWEQAPLSGKAIAEALQPHRELTYQSVMTMLAIMDRKGFVKRKKEGGSFVYRPRVTEKATTKRILNDLVDRLFRGSAAAAMLNLLETSDLTGQELQQLRDSVNRRYDD